MQTNKAVIARIKQDLESTEDILLTIQGRTAPTRLIMKIFPEISWLTRESMSILFVLTESRILIYKKHLNGSLSRPYPLKRSDIASYSDVSGLLNGGIQFKMKDHQMYKFIFKKQRIREIISHL